MKYFFLLCKLGFAKLQNDPYKILSILKELQMLNFDAMDTAIQTAANKQASAKAALDDANSKLTVAQADAANAQAQLDQRTAAIQALAN
jgi:hypothetical protein